MPSEILDENTIAMVSTMLERVTFASRKRLPPNARFDVDRLTKTGEGMVAELAVAVWAQRIQDEQVVLAVHFEASWPADWWQHLKQRWFPAWALRRWPVRLAWKKEDKREEHWFRTVALLPKFHYEPPIDNMGPYVIQTMRGMKP